MSIWHKIGLIITILAMVIIFPMLNYMFTKTGGFSDNATFITSNLTATVNATSLNGTVVSIYTYPDIQELVVSNLPLIMLVAGLITVLILIFKNKIFSIFGGN